MWRRSVDWLRYAWGREPVVFMSCVFGFSGTLIALVSPWTKDTVETMRSIPRVYPYPQLEGKNMTFYDSHGELKDVKFIF